MSLVYAFDHAHEAAPTELRHLLGGKGADLAEMTSVLGLPVPPGFTITTEACRAYLSVGAWPSGLADEIAEHLDRLETKIRTAARRPERSAAGQRSVRRRAVDAGHDGHGPQPRLERRLRRGSRQADRRRAFRVRLLPSLHRDVRAHRPRSRRATLRRAARRRAQPRRRFVRQRDPGRAASLSHEHVPASRCHRHRAAVPAGSRRAGAAGGRRGVHVVDRHPGGRVPQSRAHSARSRHRGERPGDGIREP